MHAYRVTNLIVAYPEQTLHGIHEGVQVLGLDNCRGWECSSHVLQRILDTIYRILLSLLLL